MPQGGHQGVAPVMTAFADTAAIVINGSITAAARAIAQVTAFPSSAV